MVFDLELSFRGHLMEQAKDGPEPRKPGFAIVNEDGSQTVTLNEYLPEPSKVFFAEHLAFREILFGWKIVGWQTNSFTGKVSEAVEVVVDEYGFSIFVKSLTGIKESLLESAPTEYSVDIPDDSPAQFKAYRASIVYVATTSSGISLDFYYLAPIDSMRVSRRIVNEAPLKVVLRIETLPGRLNGLLSESGESDETDY